jgi:hypothetical protein
MRIWFSQAVDQNADVPAVYAAAFIGVWLWLWLNLHVNVVMLLDSVHEGVVVSLKKWQRNHWCGR